MGCQHQIFFHDYLKGWNMVMDASFSPNSPAICSRSKYSHACFIWPEFHFNIMYSLACFICWPDFCFHNVDLHLTVPKKHPKKHTQTCSWNRTWYPLENLIWNFVFSDAIQTKKQQKGTNRSSGLVVTSALSPFSIGIAWSSTILIFVSCLFLVALFIGHDWFSFLVLFVQFCEWVRTINYW